MRIALRAAIKAAGPIDFTAFDKAADLIEKNGFWDGSSTADSRNNECLCFGLALARAAEDGHGAEMRHAATQLGWDGTTVPGPLQFIYRKNDEYEGRPEEGKAWALDTLRKLARGESLV